MSNPETVAEQIAEQLAACPIKLVTSLPDNWINELLDVIEADKRFTHIPVNREPISAICRSDFRICRRRPDRQA